jgi:hypothetical protein
VSLFVNNAELYSKINFVEAVEYEGKAYKSKTPDIVRHTGKKITIF